MASDHQLSRLNRSTVLDVQPAAAPPVDGAAVAERAASSLDILHLAELVPIVRARFGLGDGFADDAILSSLRVIAANSDERQRWLAAFNSNLGRSLASEGHDLNTALSALIALVPRPTS